MPLSQATSVPGRWLQVDVGQLGDLDLAWVDDDQLGARSLGAHHPGGDERWASVVLEPVMRIQSVSSNSGTLLVIAPLPNAVTRPATVGLCQRRAQ